jgi:hypothetical protein
MGLPRWTKDSYNNKLRNYLIDEAVCGSML